MQISQIKLKDNLRHTFKIHISMSFLTSKIADKSVLFFGEVKGYLYCPKILERQMISQNDQIVYRV